MCKKICIFAGTTEGRLLSIACKEAGIDTLACVATEYGGSLIEAGGRLRVSDRRLTKEEMAALFAREKFETVVDATHPYAAQVTENIRNACTEAGVPYLRLLREGGKASHAVYAESTAQAVELLQSLPGNILLTTGSKEIAQYAAIPDFGERVYARVLSVEESVAACRNAGLPASHIIAMQGPFTTELNEAMLRALNCAVLVTKDGGVKGGFPQKAEAAEKAGATLVVIGRPQQVAGVSLREAAEAVGAAMKPQVSIVGIGPGSRENMTEAAWEAVRTADCVIGAQRMLDAVAGAGQKKIAAIAPEKIAAAIAETRDCLSFAVVMAGDIGFFSGTKKLLPLLSDWDAALYPGLSSFVTLCARLGTSYEDVLPYSLHGRDGDIVAALRRSNRVFALVGGEDGMQKLCQSLLEAGFGEAKVSVGERLGYPDETITQGTAAELAGRTFQSLSVALIEWDMKHVVTQGLPDETFLRGSHADGSVVPMTKREVRASALAHLELTKDAVCWDIGAGTGSVSIEMALACPLGEVYAVEKKEGALELLRENRQRLHVPNLHIVAGSAPESCEALPAPTHVFIGGSGGNMADILMLAKGKNPNVRIVASAIALETVAELNRCAADLGFSKTNCVCIQASNAKKVGSYHLMTAQNPVYLFTFGS